MKHCLSSYLAEDAKVESPANAAANSENRLNVGFTDKTTRAELNEN